MDINQLNELLETSPEQLAQLQHDKLKQHILIKLNNVADAVKAGMYDIVENNCTTSPAGDGYGTDHDFIDFNIRGQETDIVEAMGWLMTLRKAAQYNSPSKK